MNTICMNDLLSGGNIIRPEHGGQLDSFCREYDFRPDQVLDLSTGMSPWAWPVPEIPLWLWQRLPHETDFPELVASAAQYYGCPAENILPVSGSQSAIEVLPQIAAPKSYVAIPSIGYQEHEYCWRRAGHRIIHYDSLDELEAIIGKSSGDIAVNYAVVINPNNPTTELYLPEKLAQLSDQLAKRSGFLVVDEAFIDAVSEYSLASKIGLTCGEGRGVKGLVILRSIGKFFGLAGLRLGFILTCKDILDRLMACSNLWSVSSVAYWLGAKILADRQWIQMQKKRLTTEVRLIERLLSGPLCRVGGSGLDVKVSTSFISGFGDGSHIEKIERHLALKGILVRTFYTNKDKAVMRVGLADDPGKYRLSAALSSYKE